ncbi:MAG: S8 family serine peptidase [Acidobacteriota bacterium]
MLRCSSSLNAFVIVLALAFPLLATSQPASPERLSVMVHLDQGADRGPLKALVAQQGAVIRYEYRLVPELVNVRELPRSAVGLLAQLPGVVRVEEDLRVKASLQESTPLIGGLQSQLATAGFPYDGEGVRVCVLDTGIRADHAMFGDRVDVAAGYDFVNDDADPTDDDGHGTHVAGIAVGGVGLTITDGCNPPETIIQGLAPAATLIGVKVLDEFGGGSGSDLLAGIDHCADPPGGLPRADVLNLSLGGAVGAPGPCDHLGAAFDAAVDLGVVIVAASGNNGNADAIDWPACVSSVIAVGSTTDGTCLSPGFPVDTVSSFSNRGSVLDVTAPGERMHSADHDSTTDYRLSQGTSQASPVVAGLAALLLDADPALTPAELRQVIRDGAVDLGPPGFDNDFGHGRVDVIGSLSLLDLEEVVPTMAEWAQLLLLGMLMVGGIVVLRGMRP